MKEFDSKLDLWHIKIIPKYGIYQDSLHKP